MANILLRNNYLGGKKMSDREMSAEEIFKKLQDSERLRLDKLPKDKCGIYALFDHAGFLRYIGYTAGAKKKPGFYGRIWRDHAAGSVGEMKSGRRHTHMFSAVYCCGRMWSYSNQMNFSPKEGDADRTADGELAKKFRNFFSREYCRATYVTIPRLDAEDSYAERLGRIEKKVQTLANIERRDYLLEHGVPGPVDLNEWEGDFEPGGYQKYTEKLDELVNKLLGSKEKLLKKSKKGFTEAEICKLPEALDHQNELYKKYLKRSI